MPRNPELLAARARARAARLRVSATFGELQDRLRPANLAQNAMDTASDGVATAARKSADVVRARPIAAAAGATLLGLFLARRPLARLVRGNDETPAAADG